MKIISKRVDEWTADIAKKMHPYSKCLKAVDWYFAAGDDDINIEWSRSFDGYSNDHFTPQILAEFYQASKVQFFNDYSIKIFVA